VKQNPMLTVIIPSYQHEKYIAQAIQSVIDQETSFPYRIVVVDDCSKDNSAEIIRGFAEKYPKLIEAHFLKENTGRGAQAICKANPIVNTPYVCYLEGDDYWCSNHKVQKLIKFLEENRDYIGCAHKTRMIYENLDKAPREMGTDVDNWSIDDIMRFDKNYYCHLSSWIWRNVLGRDNFCLPDVYMQDTKNLILDVLLPILYAVHGRLKCLPEVMSVYRFTGTGIFSSLSENQIDWHNEVEIFQKIDVVTNGKYHEILRKKVQKGRHKYYKTYNPFYRILSNHFRLNKLLKAWFC
jgi:glycosyltransferase involved in cell wall biosynthesis